MPIRISALLFLAAVLAPLDLFAATYRDFVAQVPSAPDSTQTVRVWMNSDTAFGETASVEVQIGTAYTRYDGTFDAAGYPGANWYADLPAQPAGTMVQYQLYTVNETGTAYGYTGFNWGYTVLAVDAGGPTDASSTDAGDDAGDDGTPTDAGDDATDDVAEPDAGDVDAGEPDVVVIDAAADVAVDVVSVDAAMDSASMDAGPLDTGVVDATDDVVSSDAGASDARNDGSDAGVRDSGDASRSDVAADAPGTMNNSGCSCRTTGRSTRASYGGFMAVVALVFARRRRRAA